jgi:DNA-binding Lrp family transcriptional regulator
MAEVNLDEKDREILRMLMEDAKASAKNIAAKIDAPITTVYSRIKRLEDAGVISGYKTVVDAGKLGPEVQEIHIITGDWDFLIKVKERDVSSVGRFVVDKLRTVQGISKTLTCMVFDSAKETTDVPI